VRRIQLVELHELHWFPTVWRNLVTDFLSFFFGTFKPYVCVAPVLAEALERASTNRIVDLCSGAGQPVLSLLPALETMTRSPTSIVLTDKFPNVAAFRKAVAGGGGVVSYLDQSVDAVRVPKEINGFRTLFTSFHHFPPAQARRVLADAQRNADGIGIFEFTERNLLLWTIPVLLIPLLVVVCTPLIRPFRWQRLLWTYLVPIVPLVAMWDGLVSNLRSYSPGELEELIGDLSGDGYSWRIDRVRSIGLSRVTCLVGWPNR
jgi:hypothetical protein